MNETFDSSAEKPSPWDEPGHGHQNEVANAKSCWRENLKGNLFIVLLGSVVLSFMLGYFIAQQQEARKREQWAEILFRQAKNWLTESGRKTAGSVEHGLEYARSAAEQAGGKGAEYSRQLNPFHRELRRRFFSIL
jgi:predicted negative regulator of RcsB-dependent stress response